MATAFTPTKSKGIFHGFGKGFRGLLGGAASGVTTAASATKKALYTRPGQFFTGGRIVNDVYDPKTDTRVKNTRKTAAVVLIINKRQPGFKAAFNGSGKGTLIEFIQSLNANRSNANKKARPRLNASLNSKSKHSLELFAQQAYVNYLNRQKRKENNNSTALRTRTSGTYINSYNNNVNNRGHIILTNNNRRNILSDF